MDCCNNGHIPWVARWFGFVDYVPTVPQLYWDLDSNEQRYHLLCKQLHKLICYADMLGVKINVNHETIEALKAEFEKFKNTGFLEYYEKQIQAWIDANMERIISEAIKMVFFGLTEDGYFCAYIPKSWAGIVFDTGAVYENDNYGCLILTY